MQYDIADSNLEPFMMDDLEELGGIELNDSFNVVAFVDRAAGHSDEPVLGIDNWEGAKVLHLQGEGEAEVVQDLGPVNSGDPAVLATFIAQAMRAYPAQHFALVISDHGGGWRGIGLDESSGQDFLDMTELGAGVQAGVEDYGVTRLDLLGFDACLMATYEVASTMVGTSDMMLASEENEPEHGWDYSAFRVLADDPSTTATELGQELMAGYEAQAEDAGTATNITLSLLDLTKLPAVTESLDAFAAATSSDMAEAAPVVGEERSLNLSFGRNPDPDLDSFMTDLSELTARIGAAAPDDVAALAESLTEAVDDMVVSQVTGDTTDDADGLAIYFPPEGTQQLVEYDQVEAAATWKGFLDSYHAAGSAIPESQRPQFVNAGGQAEVSLDAAGNLVVTGTYDPASIPEPSAAVIEYGVLGEDGTVTFIGSGQATIDDGTVTGAYDQTALAMSDGDKTIYAYLDIAADPEGDFVTATVPLAYYAQGVTDTYEDVALSLTLDADGLVLSEQYYAFNEAAGTYGAFTPDDQGTIVPQLRLAYTDGTEEWLPTDDTPIKAKLANIKYGPERLADDIPLHLRLTMSDYGGHTATVVANTPVTPAPG